MIQAKNISYQIGEKRILNDVSVDLKPGKFLAILGSNGAGKTTLLKNLSGEVDVQNGQLILEGENYSKWSLNDLALKRAVLSQNVDVAFQFQVMDIVLMGRYAHSKGRETPKDYVIAEDVLKKADAFQFKDRFYHTLSGGEKQRVQLARVLAQIWDVDQQNSKYLFLDEPTSSLDIEHQYFVMNSIKDFAQNQIGVFCVLHDINLAIAFADELLFLKEGKIIACGAIDDVLKVNWIRETYGIHVEIHRSRKLKRPFVVPVSK